MATLFEMWLVGDDAEHLTAVGQAVLDEIQRIENLLSRFDPSAEVYRVNRIAAAQPVLVDYELFSVLQDCRRQFDRTDGYFNVVQMSRQQGDRTRPDVGETSEARPLFPEAVELDENQRTVRFVSANVTLDLGGYGKGYVLDAADHLLDEYGIGSALLHGGTSSILVRGRREDGEPWAVGLRDPFSSDVAHEIAKLHVTDCGVSTSAVFQQGDSTSDIVDPHAVQPPGQQAACTVVTPKALDAEVLTTAFLAMGKAEVCRYLGSAHSLLPSPCSIAWVERRDGETVIEWLKGSPNEFQPK